MSDRLMSLIALNRDTGMATLLVGTRTTAVATLVERTSRYTKLVKLPGRRTSDALNVAGAEVFGQLPAEFARSLTWDQGKEIAGHADLAAATGMHIYLCDPNSPWQRPTNENTNGLLRQYFPRSTNFYALSQADLDWVADALNARPREPSAGGLPWNCSQQQGASFHAPLLT